MKKSTDKGTLPAFHVIQKGDLNVPADGAARGTSTLVVGEKGVYVVDTGSQYTSYFLSELKKWLNIYAKRKTIEDIDVIITHPDWDHTGNNHFFKKRFIYPDSTWHNTLGEPKGVDYFDTKIQDELAKTGEYELEPNIELLLTPGHRTKQDISVLLKGTLIGNVCIAGDAFMHEKDDSYFSPENPDRELYAAHLDLLMKSREKIREVSDYIIPGHGSIFEVKK